MALNLQVFYRDASDNSLRTRWRETSGAWSDEQNLGGVLSGDPFVAVLPNSSVQAFYRGADNSLWTRYRELDGSWSDQQNLAKCVDMIPIAAISGVSWTDGPDTLGVSWTDGPDTLGKQDLAKELQGQEFRGVSGTRSFGETVEL
jgi:hypothetical protein